MSGQEENSKKPPYKTDRIDDARYRDKRKREGFKQTKVWVHKDDDEALKAYALRLRAARGWTN